MHNKPLTDEERNGLRLHGLKMDKPSQLSDCFRLGMAYQKNLLEAERDALRESEKLLMKFINDGYKSATGKPSKKTAIEMMRYVAKRPKLQQLINNCDSKEIKKYRSCEQLEGEG